MQGESIGFLVAFTAGLLSFLSPCVLPLIPSYATFVTGMSLEELGSEGKLARRTALVHGALFVAGFSAVFILLGASATFLGALLSYTSRWIERVGGVLLIVFGAYMLGLLRIPGASREWRVHLAGKPVGYFGTVLVGVAFGAGWTPCIGPILGGILTLAATRASVSEGMALLAVYSAGLAIPFLASTLLIQHFLRFFIRFRNFLPWVSRISGVLLIVVGVLLLSGSLATLAAMLNRYTPEALQSRL